MTIHLDNPAGRLYAFLEAARQFAPDQPMRHAWGQALGVNPADLSQFWRRVAMVSALPDEVEQAVRRLPDANEELLLRPLPRARVALSAAFTMGGTNNLFVNEFDAITLLGLEHCSDLLHRARFEPEIDSDTLEQLQQSIDKLIQVLDKQDDLDPVLERFIREHSAAIARALVDVRIRGAEALAEVVDSVVGAMVRSDAGASGRLHPRQDDDNRTRAGFWEIVGRVANLVQIAGLPLAIAAAMAAPQLPAPAGRPASTPPAVTAPAGPTTILVCEAVATGPK